jgi:hypothetical protein
MQQASHALLMLPTRLHRFQPQDQPSMRFKKYSSGAHTVISQLGGCRVLEAAAGAIRGACMQQWYLENDVMMFLE